jgi:hypothetical protein
MRGISGVMKRRNIQFEPVVETFRGKFGGQGVISDITFQMSQHGKKIGSLNRVFYLGPEKGNVLLADFKTGGGTGLTSPLYQFESKYFGKIGLRTDSLLISPVTQAKAKQFYPGATFKEKSEWAKVIGGPAYQFRWDPKTLGIRPSRGGYGSNFPKRDVMKPHLPEWPGGRAQLWELLRGVSPEALKLGHKSGLERLAKGLGVAVLRPGRPRTEMVGAPRRLMWGRKPIGTTLEFGIEVGSPVGGLFRIDPEHHIRGYVGQSGSGTPWLAGRKTFSYVNPSAAAKLYPRHTGGFPRQLVVHEAAEKLYHRKLGYLDPIGGTAAQAEKRQRTKFLSHLHPGVIGTQIRFTTKYGGTLERKALQSYLTGQVEDAIWMVRAGHPGAKRALERTTRFRNLVKSGYQFEGVRPQTKPTDVMKPHPPDFPGGRRQPWWDVNSADWRTSSQRPQGMSIGKWRATKSGPIRRFFLDFESQGLRQMQQQFGRSASDPLFISQIALLDADAKSLGVADRTIQRTWTSIIDNELLQQFGVTDYRKLPKEFLDFLELRKKTDALMGRYGFWDRGIRGETPLKGQAREDRQPIRGC